MTLGAFSDTHGDSRGLERVLQCLRGVEALFFAGDGMEEVSRCAPEAPLYAVRGNCDWGDAPLLREVWLGELGILLVHGHLQGVKYGLVDLADLAAQRGVALAIYGHTHMASVDQARGVVLLNPGSVHRGRGDGRRTYALIHVDGTCILPRICEL